MKTINELITRLATDNCTVDAPPVVAGDIGEVLLIEGVTDADFPV